MAGVSVPLRTADLRHEVDRYGPVAYLVTVGPETGRPHVVSVEVRWEGDDLVAPAGTRTAANVGTGADVSLVWSPAPGGTYSLIVDGPSVVRAGEAGVTVAVRPAGAVLHRLAGAAGDGPGCIPVTTSPPPDQEVAVGDHEHPNATLVRRFVNAWFDGDFDTWRSLAADDIVMHMRGKSALDGSYRGRDGVSAFFEKFAALDVDLFDMEVEDVVADDRYAAVVMRAGYQRGDESLDVRAACAYRIDADGRIAEAWTVSDNQAAEADFFTIAGAHPSGLGVALGPPG
jgi:ketosteroid isomerase-like protein